jgi:hypothetical protein
VIGCREPTALVHDQEIAMRQKYSTSVRFAMVALVAGLLVPHATSQLKKFACAADEQLQQSFAQDYYHMGQSIAVGRFNDDEFLDIAMGGYSRTSTGPTQITPTAIFLGTGGTPAFRHRLTIRGTATFDGFGFSIAFIGDLNGDDCNELVVGAPRYDGTAGVDSGRVSIIFGEPLLDPDDPFVEAQDVVEVADVQDLTFEGLVANEWFGAAVATARGADGSYLKELLIGAPGGGPVNDTTIAGTVYQVETPTMEVAGVLGAALPGVAVGALTTTGTPGISGSLGTGYWLTSHRLLHGADEGDCFGSAIAFVGNLDGVAGQEFLVGAPQYQGELPNFTTKGPGYARLYKLTSASLLIEFAGEQGANGDPPRGGEACGFSVAGGVILSDDDAVPDLLIGSPLFNVNDFGTGGDVHAGRVRAYSGADAAASTPTAVPVLFDDAPNDTVLVGAHGSDQFGYSVAGVPDLDDDTVGEVLIGAWQAEIDSSSTCTTGRLGDGGSATVHLAGQFPNATEALTIFGEAVRDHLGRSVCAADVFGTTGQPEIILSGLGWSLPTGPDEIGKGYVWDGDAVLAP